jgi:Transglutaminase-like superfamily
MVDEALHFVARVLLRVCSPRRTHAILSRVGAVLPRYRDKAAVLRAGARVGRRGTCLSRALAVAARTPSADLVIGVAKPEGQSFFAHAWLELGGESIGPTDVVVSEIARLGRTAGRSRTALAE